MRINYYLQKVFSLFRDVRNLPCFIYRVHHYLKKAIPVRIAKRIAVQYRSEYDKKSIQLFWIDTYDGSSQCVHPDIVFWENKYWLTITPYPFGMEEYENPCIYSGDSFDSLKEYERNPIDKQSHVAYGNHLSDPCLSYDEDKLYCFYRKSTRIQGKTSNSIWYRCCDLNMCWSAPTLVVSSEDDSLLSPAVVRAYDGDFFMFHVRPVSGGSEIVCTRLGRNMRCKGKTVVCCSGLPQGYYVWHIGVSHEQPTGDAKIGGWCLKGIFLLRNIENPSLYSLYFAHCKNLDLGWTIGKACVLPNSLEGLIANPYKTCIIPNTRQLLISFRDKKSRYALAIIP